MDFPNYNFDPRKSILYRDIKKTTHLVYRPPFKGTPAFNAQIVKRYQKMTKYIGYRFNEKSYSIPMEQFLLCKHDIDFNGELQYAVSKSDWDFFNC